jgi:MFS family permease
VAVVACCALPSFLGGAVVDDVRRAFPFGDTAVGITFSLYWATAALAALPAARLGDRLGPLRSLRIAALLAAVVCVAVGVLAQSAASLALLLVPGGLAAALATPAVNVLIMASVDPRRRAFAFALASCSPPAGLVAAGTMVPVLGHWLDWRVLYVVAALLALGAALSLRDVDARAAAPGATGAGSPSAERPGRRRARGPRGRPGPTAGPARLGRAARAGERAAVRPLAVMMIGVTAANAALGVMSAFLVSAAPSAGVSGTTAAVVLAVGAGASIAIRLGVGRWADGHGRDPLPSVAALMVVGAGGFGLMAVAAPVPFVVGALLVLGPGWVWLSLFSFAIVTRYADAVAAATGVMQTGFFAGGVLGPVLFGVLSSAVSYRLGWAVLLGASLVAAGVVGLGRARLPPHVATDGAT